MTKEKQKDDGYMGRGWDYICNSCGAMWYEEYREAYKCPLCDSEAITLTGRPKLYRIC